MRRQSAVDDIIEEKSRLVLATKKEFDLDGNEAEVVVSVRDNFAEPFKLLSQYDSKSVAPPLSLSLNDNKDITADELMVGDEEWSRDKQGVYVLTPERAYKFVGFVKREFPENGGFGVEQKPKALESIIDNVNLQLSRGDAYPTPLAKAVHLFYFVIKNHPFVDGNKRMAIFLFCMFLEMHSPGIIERRVGYAAMPVVALFVAVSDSGDKEQVVNFVMRLIKPQE